MSSLNVYLRTSRCCGDGLQAAADGRWDPVHFGGERTPGAVGDDWGERTTREEPEWRTGFIQEVPNQRREEYLTSTPDPQLTSRRTFVRNWGATFTFPTTSCLLFHMSFTSLPGQSVTFLPLPLPPPPHRVLFCKRSSCQHVWNIT